MLQKTQISLTLFYNKHFKIWILNRDSGQPVMPGRWQVCPYQSYSINYTPHPKGIYAMQNKYMQIVTQHTKNLLSKTHKVRREPVYISPTRILVKSLLVSGLVSIVKLQKYLTVLNIQINQSSIDIKYCSVIVK